MTKTRTKSNSLKGNKKVKPPTTYEDLVHEISGNFQQLSKRLKQVASYALDHPNDFAIDTIAEIARKADVQPSVLIRFAQAFGFSGFSNAQRLFQQRLLETRPSYKSRLKSVRDSVENSPPALLNMFVESNKVALDHLQHEIPPQKLKDAIHILNQAEVIHIMAMRRAFPLAASFFYSVSTMGRRAQLIDNVGGLSGDLQDQIGPNDCLFVASFSNYTPAVVEAAEHTLRRNIPVVAITDHPLSPLTTNSSVCFHVEDAVVYNFRSLSASMCLVQTLVVGLGVDIS